MFKRFTCLFLSLAGLTTLALLFSNLKNKPIVDRQTAKDPHNQSEAEKIVQEALKSKPNSQNLIAGGNIW